MLWVHPVQVCVLATPFAAVSTSWISRRPCSATSSGSSVAAAGEPCSPRPIGPSWAASARVLSRDRWRSFLVAPDTLVRWHRDLLSRHVRGSRRPGRPPLDPSIKHLVLRLGRENPRWCYLRIRGELLKLGIDVSATTIATVLRQGDLGPPRPAGSGRPGRSSCGCRPTASSPSAPPERRRVRRTWHRIRGSCRLGYARPQARPRKTRPSMTILLHRAPASDSS